MTGKTLGLATGGLLALALVAGACADKDDGASQTSAELRGGNKPDAQVPPGHAGKPDAGPKGNGDNDQDESTDEDADGDESADGDAASDEDSDAVSDEDSDAASDESDSDGGTDETPKSDAGARPDASRGHGKPK